MLDRAGTQVRFRLLGRVCIETDTGVLAPVRRQERCLLAILLIESGRVVPLPRLCELIWDDKPPLRAHEAVRSQVAHLRALLVRAGAGPGVDLTSDHNGYVLRVPPGAVDAHLFRDLVERAGRTPDLAERERLLREALALWQGPALHNAATERLRQRLCADLEELRAHAIEERLATGLELGRHHELLPELTRLSSEQPVRERLVQLHMLALYRQGRSAEALDVYRRTRDGLADEFGIDPSPTLQLLHRAILRGDPVSTVRPVPGPAPADAAAAVRGSAARPVRWSEVRPVPALLPPDPPDFVGRAEQLRRLDSLAAGTARAVLISSIAGTAGVGKTTLAVHWAHRVRHRFPDGQLYADLRGFDRDGRPVSTAEAVRGFLDALDVALARIPATVDAQIGLYRSLLADRRMLVVLDNARDSEQVRPLLPAAPGCLTLVTSRNQLTGLIAVDGARSLTLDLLTVEEARLLLGNRLGTDVVEAEPAAVDELIALSARLPLALVIAAAHRGSAPGPVDRPVAALVDRLRRGRTALDVLTGDEARSDLRAVFDCSYQALSPPAARLFRLLGLHPGPDISTAAAASLAGLHPDRARPLLGELTRKHLLTEHNPGRYTFHDLLRAYAAELADTHDTGAERHTTVERMLDHYLHTAHTADRLVHPYREPVPLAATLPGVTPQPLTDQTQAMEWFTVEHPTLVATVRLAADTGFDTHTWQLAWTLVIFLDRQGHWNDHATVQLAAVSATRRLGNPTAQGHAHRQLARAYLQLRRYDDVRANLENALDLYRRAGDLTGQANIHNNLAQACERQARYGDALDHARQSLDLHREAGNRRGQTTALNAIGWYHGLLGDYEQALTYCRQALAQQQEHDDVDGQAETWDSLGYAQHRLAHYAEAATCYDHALVRFRELGDRYNEAATLTHLGDTHNAAGNPAAAAAAWRRALAILDDLDHPDANQLRANLADIGEPSAPGTTSPSLGR